jgi:hypothetical protein
LFASYTFSKADFHGTTGSTSKTWHYYKHPWHSKSKQKHSICKPTDNAPGKQASIDQMVFAQPDLLPQMRGHLTNLRIMGATIFVDHVLDHIYIYLMKDLMLSQMLMAKHAYKHILHCLG